MVVTNKMKHKKYCKVDFNIEASAWLKMRPAARGAIKTAFDTTMYFLLPDTTTKFEISVLLTSDKNISKINSAYRQKDKATNVLSFPQQEFSAEFRNKLINRSAKKTRGAPGKPDLAKKIMLGDIIFAYETIAIEAKNEDKTMQQHLSHLAVHGILHLFGFDHVIKNEAKIMENLETKILKQLAIPDPYFI